jgi:arylsulfatase
MYLDQPIPDVPIGDWVDVFAAYADPCRHNCLAGDIAPSVLHRTRAGYYGHMSHVDQQVNRFLEALHLFGLHDNTYVCFVSDHGEMLGDHHLFRKCYPYEGSAHVPLILRGPADSGILASVGFDHVIELRDVMPTLLDCAGLPIPETVEGRSFLAIARGESSEWRSYLHGEHVVLGQSLQWLTDGHEKYIWFSGTGHEQLFNLDGDPQELHDLACQPSCAVSVTHWRQVLIEELTGREEGFTDGKRLIPGQAVNPCLLHLRRQAGLD